MTRRIIAISILAFTIQAGFSQSFDKARLDSYFQALENADKFMGSVAISQNGKIIYTKQTGFADVDNKIKPDDNTKYRIGSISKTFTTVLVFKAIEENKLKLTDKIDNYFPSIKNAGMITIGNLLYHRSGIHNFTASGDYLKWNTEKKTEEQLIEMIAKGGSDFEPGSKADYSNSNFVLLSFILQKIYKKSYAQLLTEKITKPAGLKNTYFGKQTNIKDNESYSYSFKGNWTKETETDMSIPMGAGAIVSTPGDLAQFADALFNGKLVQPVNLEAMKTLVDNYGMGLFKVPFGDRSGYGHTGGIDGFSSVLYHFDDGNVSMALTSNGTTMDNNQISIVLLSAVYDIPYEIPTFKSFEVTSEALDKYLGVYSSTQIPLKITITKNDKTLIAQATGQPAFALEANEKDRFTFDKAGVVLEFNPTARSMTLKQGGGTFTFSKE
ncbi:MAG TPA: serine hydrolase domain-containing protein [Ferruginibacter sp.]|nr:serine hydrolase domain-containing protein [Ferruginibacter sp.]